MRRELAIDAQIAEIADRQGGVVARAQLLDLALRPSAIDRRVRAGRLHTIHRGVYTVGHRVIGARGRCWAAVLACGDGAVLSHISASRRVGDQAVRGRDDPCHRRPHRAGDSLGHPAALVSLLAGG